MHTKTFIICIIFVSLSCNSNNVYSTNAKKESQVILSNDINPYRGINEIPLPHGFTRTQSDPGSFAAWLLNVKLKKDKMVYKFDGTPKANQNAQFAVMDISVGDQDLQQCADAVMRLRAEYLFAVKKYEDIHFTDNGGTVYQFYAPHTDKNLHQFLQKVFGRCGSASLAKQLKGTAFNDIKPGDVLIRGGFPGHAVIVMDVAINSNGKKIYLLAQSYMPAQDIHVLINPANNLLSPWYEADDAALVETPEYTFTKKELKKWPEIISLR
ncbi:MAG: DUF4846 domain-containing protein [Ferruginibacter sp.]